MPRHAGRRLRLPHRAGQRPGRARARPEGRPAARLPDDRRPGRPRARRRRLGRRPGRRCPARGARPTSCSTRSAPTTARRRCWCSARNLVVSAPSATHVAERLDALDLLVVADIVLSETAALRRRRAAGHPVGRGDRHDDQPRGPGDPAAAGGRRRPTGVRSDLDVLAGLAARLGSPVAVRDRPGGGLRRAAAGPRRAARPTTPGITYDRIRDGARRVLALPDRRPRRAPRGCSSTASPPRRPGPVPRRSSTAAPAEEPVARLPGAPHHRPGARAVPVRRPDPPGPRPRPTPAPFVELHPIWPAGSAPPTASRSASPPGAAR